MNAPMHLPAFVVRQKLTLMVNRYEISTPEGRVMAVAQQKRMAFREQVTFYTDDTKTRAVFSFKARQVMDLGAGYDVLDESGAPIGFFRKDFGRSLLRSTFHLGGPGVEATGQERSQGVAIARRVLDFPFPFHFDFLDPQGQPVMSIDRKFALRDRYSVEVPDPRLDFRLAAAMAVGVDALMSR